MSDNQEKSDDLIAELAKLMASNASGAEPDAKPALSMPPLGEASVPSPGPLRIPGMQPIPTAAPAPVPLAAPTIRIPGMSQPIPAAAPVAAAPAEPAPAPRPQFDFGKPPTMATPIAPEPMSNWQTSEVPKLAPLASLAPAPRPMAEETRIEPPRQMSSLKPVGELKPNTGFKPVPMSRIELGMASAAPAAAPAAPIVTAPVLAPSFAPKPTSNAPAGDGFDFDFGFGGEEAGEKPSRDPIADLIAAELDSADAQPVAVAPQPVPTPPPVPVAVATTPSAAQRNFANPSQAPVLVGRPTGNGPARPAVAPMAPRPAAPARSETDRFAVAPVFGLGGKTAPAARESDPMDEIESLIGEAVRVELTAPEKAPSVSLAPPPPVHAPVVPPLSSQFAPRRTALKDTEPPMHSAEAAILAAAAATGAEVGRVESAGEDRTYKRMKVKPPKSRGMSGGARQYIGMAVAGTLLLAAGFGLYWVLGMGRSDPSTAPVLVADTVKKPAPVVSTVTPDTGASGVFDQLEGKVADSPETLVSRDETAGASVADVARVVDEGADETEAGLANRKVRTVTVRPDGTIVPGDGAVAGAEVLPVARPDVPALPGEALEPSDLLAQVQTAEIDPIAEAIAGGDPALTAEPSAVNALVASVPTTTTNVIDPTLKSPRPMPRPTSRDTMVGGENQVATLLAPLTPNTPASTPLTAVQPTEVVASSGGGAAAYVQLSSQRSEGDALAALRNAQSKWSGLLQGNQLEIQRADLGQKGVYYRVRLPASTLQSATSICASIKANGGDCFATNG